MILVTGATGTIGRELVTLLASKAKPLRVLARNPEKAREVFSSLTVEYVRADLGDPASLDAAMAGGTKLFLLSSPDPRQVELQRNAIRAAKRAKVRHVVKVSSVGTAPEAPYQVGRWHAQIEREIEEARIPYTFLRPTSFMQNLLNSARTIRTEGVLYGSSGDGKFAVIDARDVAAVAFRALTGRGHRGRVYELTGPEALSYGEMAKQLGRAIKRRIRYVDLTPDQLKAGMLKAGLPEFLADDLLVLERMNREGQMAGVTDTVREVIKRKPRPFRRFARDYAEAFAQGD